MKISYAQPDKYAERVCIHKFAFTTVRTISLGAGRCGNFTSYFSLSDASTFSKYSRQAPHHALIRVAVRLSQQVSSALQPTTFSTVSTQCRLYGTSISGSSWCIFRQLLPLQRNRLITSMRVIPPLSMYVRSRIPITSSVCPHTGQTWNS